MVEPKILHDAVRGLARASRIVERASLDLSFADYRVMSSIEGGEGRASRLADRLALGKPTVSATVESLSKRGLIVRSKVDGDNRAVALTLSDEGRDLFERMQARMSRQLDLLAQRTDDADRLIEALAMLDKAVDAAMRERHEKEVAHAGEAAE
ncbi:MAG TPA: MarR family transcriptional regulator [Galbitalea sp.]|jgi:DNA-binding MarR family transcriptional regulator|nr:MarR family transcriptional regulator [Galbitalea sp.]